MNKLEYGEMEKMKKNIDEILEIEPSHFKLLYKFIKSVSMNFYSVNYDTVKTKENEIKNYYRSNSFTLDELEVKLLEKKAAQFKSNNISLPLKISVIASFVFSILVNLILVKETIDILKNLYDTFHVHSDEILHAMLEDKSFAGSMALFAIEFLLFIILTIIIVGIIVIPIFNFAVFIIYIIEKHNLTQDAIEQYHIEYLEKLINQKKREVFEKSDYLQYCFYYDTNLVLMVKNASFDNVLIMLEKCVINKKECSIRTAQYLFSKQSTSFSIELPDNDYKEGIIEVILQIKTRVEGSFEFIYEKKKFYLELNKIYNNSIRPNLYCGESTIRIMMKKIEGNSIGLEIVNFYDSDIDVNILNLMINGSLFETFGSLHANANSISNDVIYLKERVDPEKYYKVKGVYFLSCLSESKVKTQTIDIDEFIKNEV